MGKATHKGKFTRKWLVKSLMAIGIQRNQAELGAVLLHNSTIPHKSENARRSLLLHPEMLNFMDATVFLMTNLDSCVTLVSRTIDDLEG